MNQKTLDAVEAGVERLITAYAAVRSENSHLREELASMKLTQDKLKSRLDALIARIDKAVKP